ncbi:hypothetical protein [Candidatus Bacteroides intestinigallinarum]|uniref:hypothetical protein n=1 Tax=Candidatus Bacteroides intestinigallinarum TaxID=2838470 RepID=UPI0021651967|nr:hypothetical protein [Candidatus Bacteroides intestinigallinarum]MCS3200241.1 hypothetical protein [Candidatus Bacteroides intestinigallinarum]
MGIFIISVIVVFVLFVVAAVINSRCHRPGPPITINAPASKKEIQARHEDKDKYEISYTMGTTSEKVFSQMVYTDKDDVDALLYTTTICNNAGVMYAFEVFRHTLANEKIAHEMISVLERETAVLSQFQTKQETSDLGSTEVTPGMIGELIATLIMSGLDAHYALEEMELCDLPLYIEAYERKKKEQMESDRLWTYLNILPHVDGKKLPSARDLYSFPWEEMEDMKEAERALAEDAETFEIFMNNGINNCK